MKQILDYFMIDGEVGGNQDWFRNVVMHIGGCAAATACDCCIYFAKYKGKKNLYPFDAENLSKEDYIQFSMKMKPYLRPRMSGVNKLWMYTEGFGKNFPVNMQQEKQQYSLRRKLMKERRFHI